MNERRLVLVLGAGASRDLGADDRPMPVMGDWASDLRERIGEDLYLALGLEDTVDGAEFEERIGDLLQFNRLRPLIERLRAVGFPPRNNPNRGGVDQQFQNWLQFARSQGEQIVQELNAGLWDQFGPDRVDAERADIAYHNLTAALGCYDDNRTRLSVATTNYDRAFEDVVGGLGLSADDGFRRPAPSMRPRADFAQILDWSTRDWSVVPVLHLHGAVGWYRNNDGSIWATDADQPYDPNHEPAVLHPDPLKDPNESPLFGLWGAFHRELEQATHVLVLGHSLHDPQLVRSIAAGVDPSRRGGEGPARVMVTHHSLDEVEPMHERQRGTALQAADLDMTEVTVAFGPNDDCRWAAEWMAGPS